MRQAVHSLSISSRGRGLYEFTREVRQWLEREKFSTGLLTIYCRHTSASLLIQENADPDVQTDLQNYFEELAPESERYIHSAEGPDDMPAHLRAALTQTSLSIPIVEGDLVLGTWQGIYLFEHRTRPHRREIVLHVIGE
ncbi:MAG TPA: secondary thiamine-phosphate synthase enzyme YjbQ [Xanthobacteraceae bacterium]|nr:secondary thiamine-phosphate synthase enzyme YjbQ [Xanthobacteraceae bacterium]